MKILRITTTFFILGRLSRSLRPASVNLVSTTKIRMSELSKNTEELSLQSNPTIFELIVPVPEDITTSQSTSQSQSKADDVYISTRPDNGLLIYQHPDCYEHNIPDHPEQPDRISFILKALKEKYTDEYFREAPLATFEHVALFHDQGLLDKFNNIAAIVESAHLNKKYGYKRIDDDTVVMWKTRPAALRAVGAMIQAIDDVFSSPREPGKVKTAFCCVRPPGHHAERSRSMGFCFFNNVGIGAKYAQAKYGLTRVAVIDFDVHHGNGTEEGFTEFETLFFGSSHEKDNYPGTGADPTPFIGDNVRNPIHRRIVNRYLPAGKQSRIDFKKKWREIVDEMILFKPELIIVSAGFDAHASDPLSGTKLVEEDYEWATDIIVDASRTINAENPPSIISSLEGGYNLEYLAKSALVHVNVLANSNNQPNIVVDDHHGGDEVAALADHIKGLDIHS